MFTKTLTKFRALPKTTQLMVYLYWVYGFVQVISSAFLGILVFVETNSLSALLTFNFFLWVGAMGGFCVWGFIVAQRQMSMRLNYMKTFAIYTGSFLFLFFFHKTALHFNIFAFLNGFALGMFWVGVHSFEMVFTKNKNRDFYSSMTLAGKQVFTILAPLFATITFYLSEHVFFIETYTILLWALPLFYLLSFPFLFSLPDFVPPRISFTHTKELFFAKRFRTMRHFSFITGLAHPFSGIIIPVIAITSLGSVVNVGIFETIIGIVSLLSIIIVAHYRSEKNRTKILWLTTCGILIALSFLFFYDVFWMFYIVYALLYILVRPLFRVSEHVMDLYAIDQSRSVKNSFYETLLFRDFLLFCARMVVIVILAVSIFVFDDDTITIKGAIILWGASIFLYALYAQKFIYAQEKNNSTV